MSITSGFYNSSNHDRKYNSKQISQMFDGLIADGVYQGLGEALTVKASTGMDVIVSPGRAWFNHTWTLNDSPYPITLPPSEILLDCIYSIVLEVNASDAVRENTIKYVKGTPSSSPKPPELINTVEVHQYPLANVYVKAGVTEIKQENITNLVGTSKCPFVTGIIDVLSIDNLTGQWQDQFNRLFAEMEKQIEQIIGSVIPDGAVSSTHTGVALSTGWAVSGDIFTQTVEVLGVKASSKVVIDVNTEGLSNSRLQEVTDAWGGILKTEITDDHVILYSTEQSSVNIPFKILEVKK